MDNLEMILKAIVEAATPTLTLIGKGTATSLLVIVLSWFSVEHILGLLPRLRRASPELKRALAIMAGQAAVLAAHGTNVIDYGPGPRGWWAAAFFSFLGGAFAPWLHGMLKRRFPEATNSAAGPGAPA